MNLKERMVVLIGAAARERLGDMSGELAQASSEEKEDILAEIEFERWLADCCRDALWKP